MGKIWILGIGFFFLFGKMAFADVKVLHLLKGEKYELRITSEALKYDTTERNPVLRKSVDQEFYTFKVKEAHRKKGYVLEIIPGSVDTYIFKKMPDDPLWQEIVFWNSEIIAPDLMGRFDGGDRTKPFTLYLTPDFQIPDSLHEPEGITPLLKTAFSGNRAAYRMIDTVIRQEYPEGIYFIDDWHTPHHYLTMEEQVEIRFTRVDTSPFPVVCGEDKQYTETWPETNTRLTGVIRNPGDLKSVRIGCSRNFPIFEKIVYTVPLTDGRFELRLNLKESLPYVGLPGRHYLWLEPGDDLTVTMDSLGAGEIQFSGLGAGNNAYYIREGANWGYSLYKIDQDRLCSRDHYKALDQKGDLLRQRLEQKKASLTPAFYRYMLNDFKYRITYHKLMAERDTTVGQFDCIRNVEICNPLALNVEAYQNVLREVMYYVMPSKLSEITRCEGIYTAHYERAVALLDGKVLNYFLGVLVIDKLRGEFETGKRLYERYKKDYLKSPYMAVLDEFYRNVVRLAPGSVAPGFTLTDTAGHKVSLSDFLGKVVYIDFWGTGCGPCMYEFKQAAPALEEHFKDKEVVFLNISDDRNEKVWKKTLEEFNIQGINLLDTKDTKVGKLYLVTGIPHYVLIGKDGKIIDASAPRPSMGVKEIIEKALLE